MSTGCKISRLSFAKYVRIFCWKLGVRLRSQEKVADFMSFVCALSLWNISLITFFLLFFSYRRDKRRSIGSRDFPSCVPVLEKSRVALNRFSSFPGLPKSCKSALTDNNTLTTRILQHLQFCMPYILVFLSYIAGLISCHDDEDNVVCICVCRAISGWCTSHWRSANWTW